MGQTSQRLSLADCIALAIKNNPMLQRSELELSRNEVNYKQSKYNRLPAIAGNVGHSYNEGRSINTTTNQFVDNNYYSGSQSLSLSAPIFRGFEILHDIRRKASARQAGKFEFESAINELKLDVIEAYILVLTSRDMLQQAEGQLAVTQENLRRATVMQGEGAINPGDYHDLKGQAYAEQNTLENTKRDLYNNEARLAALLYLPVAELPSLHPLAMPSSVASSSETELYEEALQVLPNFKALDWRIREAEQAIKVAKSAYYPTLSLDAGIRSIYSSVDVLGYNYWQQLVNYPSKAISLSLSVPIFSRMAVRSQVKLAKLNLEEAKWNRKIQENDIREETAKTVFSMLTLKKNVQNLQEQELSYQEAFRIAQVHFDAGNSNSVLFLTAKNKLDNTRNELLIRQYQWLLQKYFNDYYAGLLEL
ncbi:transporter [Sphingobacterium griseoflavum]|uniref:Transporter n=2 Tax=Sphingobacterium griseoflavum TaxID=1474952 RepID=A0ABQ3HUW5_9SPHI|nr:transporter [Sphingobacterium griseoflavum]